MSKKTELPFATNLCRVMEERNFTIRRAAKAAGVPKSTIDGWRSGKSPDDLLAVRRLAQALDISFSFLITGQEDIKRKRQPTLSEVLIDAGELFDGIVQIKVRHLIPKNRED